MGKCALEASNNFAVLPAHPDNSITTHCALCTFPVAVTRLYAFGECEVIVDPIIDEAEAFPGGIHASGLKWTDAGASKPSTGEELANDRLSAALKTKVDFTKEEWDAFGISDLLVTHFIKSGNSYLQPAVNAWGFINRVPYGSRGWCCAEFSVARKNKRIVNMHKREVQRVLSMREWPNNVHEYAAMMDEDAEQPVRFTNKGDMAAVLYNFYKMTVRCVHGRVLECVGVRRMRGRVWAFVARRT